MNTVAASFNTTVRQMTKMSQWPLTSMPQQKMTEISQRKKTAANKNIELNFCCNGHVNSIHQLCPTEIAYWAKNYVTISSRATH